MTEEMYNKFLVMKWDWLKESLNKEEMEILGYMLNKASASKPNHSYYVVNLDEPYAEKVKQIILEGEESK